MFIQRTPNGWSCLAASFATILGCSFKGLILEVGHDGSEIVFPGLPDPYCRRSFHIQEMIDCCDLLNLSVTPFEAQPVSLPSVPEPFVGKWNAYKLDFDGNARRLMNKLENRIGVITGVNLRGAPHAVAWDGQNILDPASGETYGVHLFSVQTFWRVQSNQK